MKHRPWALMALLALPGCGTSPGPVTARPLPVDGNRPVVAPALSQPVEPSRPMIVPASPLNPDPSITAPAVPVVPPGRESQPERNVRPTAVADEAVEQPSTVAPLGPLPESQLTDLPTGDIRVDEMPSGTRSTQAIARVVRPGFGLGRAGFAGVRRFGAYGRPYWRPGWRNWWNYGRYRYAYIGGYYYPYYWTGASWYPYTFYDGGLPYQPYFSYYGGSLVPGATIVTQPMVQQPFQPIVQQPFVQQPAYQAPGAQMPVYQGQFPGMSQGQFPAQFPGQSESFTQR